MTPAQFWAGLAVVMVGYVVGFYFQHRDFEHLEASLNKRIDDLQASLNRRIDDLKDLLRSEVKRLEERIDRLEPPLVQKP